MFLVPAVLFTAYSIGVSLSPVNSTQKITYRDTQQITSQSSNTETTSTLGRVVIGDKLVETAFDYQTKSVNDIVQYESILDFTYEGGKYTDVPDSVDVSSTNHVGFNLQYLPSEDLLAFNCWTSNISINMIWTFQSVSFRYWNYDTNLYTRNYTSMNSTNYDSVIDFVMTSRDDDDFQITMNPPTGMISQDDAFNLCDIRVTFYYLTLPYYDSSITGDEYQLGYNDGYMVGSDTGYTNGYDTGYAEGNDTGYSSGYATGYNDGYDLGQTADINLRRIFFQIADVPIVTIRGLFDFELFGVSMYAVIGGFVALLVFVWVIRKLI